jgi:hypothetical protein
MVFSINEGNGYRYEAQYSPDRLADDIVQYLLERRQAPINNRLLLVSELLNVPGLTPEIFYGPMLAIPAGEALPVGDGFTLRRDEYGDLVAEYAYSDYDQAAQEQSRQELQQLQEQFGRFMDFPGLGLDRLQQNALTRGMSEPPVGVDEEGNEYIVEPPLPLGLEDIFTTFSTGKININTASVPVLFALLSSLTDEEANLVALDIRDYRNRFQEELPDEEGVETVEESKNPDLGQPKRRSQRDKEKEAAASGSVDAGTLPGAAGASGLPGLDALGMEGMESTYQNLETNYFTNLKQLELIDGTEGGPGDLLRSDEGVERVSDEQDTLLRRVERDLEKVAVFGSTYFNVELKGKPEKGRNVKTGYVTVRRDPQKGMIEILMWKELEK